MHKLFLIVGLALVSCAAYAQNTYFRSVMPDGRVIVGDKPAPGAKEVTEIPLRANSSVSSLPATAPAKSDRAAPGKGSASPSAGPSSPVSSPVPAAKDSISDLQDNLDKAKKALEAGKEPLPNERIGNANGSSRLTDAYTKRIQGLQDAVNVAQKRLDDAQRGSASR